MAAFSYQSGYNAVANAVGTVGHQIGVGLVQQALAIYAESSGTAGHAARAAFATKVLNNPDAFVWPAMLVCLVDPTILAGGVAPTDAQVATALQNAWNALAGA